MSTFVIPETAQPETSQPETAPTDPPAPKRKSLWRRGWFRWLIGVGFTGTLLTVLILILLSQASVGGQYDPRNSGPAGAAALVALIQQEGVVVNVHTAHASPAGGSGVTVVITAGNNLQKPQFDELLSRSPHRVILAGFSAPQLARLGLPVTGYFGPSDALLEPECDYPIARKAGNIENPGVLYQVQGSSAQAKYTCYAANAQSTAAAYLQFDIDGVEVAVIGGGFENRALSSKGSAEPQGNAAFMMMAFGQDRIVSWWVVPQPRVEGGNRDRSGSPSLLPPGAVWVVLTGIALLVVVGVWRGRRLGPIITERLPVVVRASETVEGHGRMYHRLRSYDRAAEHLRTGVLARLGRRFGTNDPARLAEIVAERGRIPASAAHHAFAGPPPTTEIELLELKQLLHRIEQEARS